MRACVTWLTDIFWQVAAIAAVPATITAAIAFPTCLQPSYPDDVGEHVHTQPDCIYCIASRRGNELVGGGLPVNRVPCVPPAPPRGL